MYVRTYRQEYDEFVTKWLFNQKADGFCIEIILFTINIIQIIIIII
jgi:hypothetical protein